MKHIIVISLMFFVLPLYAQDWPREVLSSEGTITMYQPQIESYSGNSMKARAAVSIVPAGKEEHVFGAIWVTCRVLTDRPTRMVKLEEMEVRRIRFPDGTTADTAKIAEALEEVIPRFDLSFSLDLLLESIGTAQKERENARELEMSPPNIIILDHPAVLVRVDGDPIQAPVSGTTLTQVVNTPFFIVQEMKSRKYFLRGGDLWFSAKKIQGPWRQIPMPPNSVLSLSDQMQSEDESPEDSSAKAIVAKTGMVPEIVVSMEQAELVTSDGPLQFIPVQGTGLLYASNTPSRLFIEIKTQRRFILISGRWYVAPSFQSPWAFISSDKLPEDFKNIPPGSECDDILASVAGTIPAREAVFDAQIPQMAEVDRTETSSTVEYDGDPMFEPIEATGMEYAVNTPNAILRANGRYYNCDRGIWFVGSSPVGPWDVCIDVPDIIYKIPASCPIYNVRYVRVYNHTPSIVYVGYTAGYTGCYVYGRTVVYGTGYRYHAWFKHQYYARPSTWGFNVHYNPWMGWTFGAWWGQSHGWFVHRPKYEYLGWWGPAKYRPIFHPAKRPVYREGYHPVHKQLAAITPPAKPSGEMRRTIGKTRSATLYDNRSSGVRRPIAIGSPASSRQGPPSKPAASPQNDARPATRPLTPPATQPAPRPIPGAGVTQFPRPADTRPATRPVPPPVVQPGTQPTPGPTTQQEPRQPVTVPPARPVAPSVMPPQAMPQAQPVQQSQQRIITRPSRGENNVYVAPNGNILRSTPQGWQQRDQNTWKNAADTPAKQETQRDSEIRNRAAERSSNPRPIAPAQGRSSDDKDKGGRR